MDSTDDKWFALSFFNFNCNYTDWKASIITNHKILHWLFIQSTNVIFTIVLGRKFLDLLQFFFSFIINIRNLLSQINRYCKFTKGTSGILILARKSQMKSTTAPYNWHTWNGVMAINDKSHVAIICTFTPAHMVLHEPMPIIRSTSILYSHVPISITWMLTG